MCLLINAVLVVKSLWLQYFDFCRKFCTDRQRKLKRNFNTDFLTLKSLLCHTLKYGSFLHEQRVGEIILIVTQWSLIKVSAIVEENNNHVISEI